MRKLLYQLVYRIYENRRYGILKDLGLVERVNMVGGLKFSHFSSKKGTQNLILLHGLLDASFGFRKVIPYLDGNWRIFIPDIPGFGKNKLPKISYLLHLDQFSLILYDWIQSLKLEDITLVGHSMGGLISQHIVLQDMREKRLIKKLILLSSGNSPHPKREDMRALLFPKNRSEVLRLLHELYYRDFPDPSPVLQDALVSIWNTPMMEILTENTLKRENEIFFGKKAGEIRIPTHILVGRDDRITSPEMMHQLNRWIEGSTIEEIENAKHAIHLEYPQKIGDFINRYGNLK